MNENLPAKPRRADVILTREKRAAFLVQLEETGNVSRTCKVINISRQTAYVQKNKGGQFAELWNEAIANYTDGLEAEVDRRAFQGNKKPVFHRGEKVGDTYAALYMGKCSV